MDQGHKYLISSSLCVIFSFNIDSTPKAEISKQVWMGLSSLGLHYLNTLWIIKTKHINSELTCAVNRHEVIMK